MTPLLISPLLFSFPFFGSDETDNSLDGYIEVDYVYVASVQNGRIDAIEVQEGENVEQGSVVFTLDDVDARAMVAAAQSTLAQAEVALRNAQTNLARTRSLVDRKAVERAQLDQATDLEEEAQEQMRTAKANLARAQYGLEERSIHAPIAGLVDDVYYSDGEVVTAGTPLMAIKPEHALKAVVYLPEPLRSSVDLGEEVKVSCDGCSDDLRAVVTKIEEQPQFSPPMIYSRETRGRFVYRMEAELQGEIVLNAGQPVTLELLDEN